MKTITSGFRVRKKPIITGVLEPLKFDGGKDRVLVSFDSEDDSEGNVLLFDFYDGWQHKSFRMDDGSCEFEDVVRWIYGYPGPAVFVAHNLEYDIVNLFRDLNYIFVEEMIYTSKLITVKLKKSNHIFWDSTNFFMGSLKKMGEIVGMKKGDYLLARELGYEENLKYCRQDTEILYAFLNRFQGMLRSDVGVRMGPTIGKMAMDVFRRKFLKREFGQFSHPSALDAFYGGRTECFFLGDIRGKIFVDDVNSMYPDAMMKEYPDTGCIREGSSYKEDRFGVGYFIVDVPSSLHVPPLPYRYKKRLWFPVGRLSGWWTYEEIRNAEVCGCTVLAQKEGFGTNVGCYPFRAYVKKYYELRKANNTDKFLDTFYKLLLNNLYGKTVQHSDKCVMRTERLEGKRAVKSELKKVLGPFLLYREKLEGVAPTSNYLWGAYVTSYARIKIQKAMSALHQAGHRLLYCDTDSIFYCEKKGAPPPPYSLTKKLGDWGRDEYVRAEITMSKGYILHEMCGGLKIACKGIPTQDASGFLNAKEEFLRTGSAVVHKPVKLREGFIQELRSNVWRGVDKKMRSIYRKRRKLASGVTAPVDVGDLDRIVRDMDLEARLNRD